jgi:hypothetical protein
METSGTDSRNGPSFAGWASNRGTGAPTPTPRNSAILVPAPALGGESTGTTGETRIEAPVGAQALTARARVPGSHARGDG